MIVRVFDVKAGACALIITDDKRYIMVDCHGNSETGWNPGDYLLSRGIKHLDLLVITNYDEDHCSGFPELNQKINIRQILRNKSVSPAQIRRLKDEGGIGRGVEALATAVERTFTVAVPPEERIRSTNFNYEAWRLTPNEVGDDSNNLSLVFEARCADAHFLFTGDLKTTGWDLLRPQVAAAVRRAHFLMAPHHGRENAQWEGFKDLAENVLLTVISDKGHMYDTQARAVPFYSKISEGAWFNGAKRYVLTTRNDGSIQFRRTAAGTWAIEPYEETYRGIEA